MFVSKFKEFVIITANSIFHQEDAIIFQATVFVQNTGRYRP
jgi:hypothetical protein